MMSMLQSGIDEPQSTPTVMLLTPRGRGAVATVRFVGDPRRIDEAPLALFRAANGKPLAEQRFGRIVFGYWGDVEEEVVVCRTSEETVEIHCHGGEAAVRRILDDLQAAGCRVCTWQEDTADRCSRFDVECLEAVTRATTFRTSSLLLQQQSGVLKSAIFALLDRPWTEDARRDAAQRLDELLAWSRFGLHLSQPWSVVLAGRPNVGKSSLINALVGYSRSIVYDQPGTTRDIVTAETAFEGWPIRLTDTAGIREQAQQLESAGIELARRSLTNADCRVLLLDTSRPPHEEDERLLQDWPDALLVAHKCDLPNAWSDHLPQAAMPVSSVTGAGLEKLASQLVARLVPKIPASGTPIPITQRQASLLTEARRALESDETTYRHVLRTCLS